MWWSHVWYIVCGEAMSGTLFVVKHLVGCVRWNEWSILELVHLTCFPVDNGWIILLCLWNVANMVVYMYRGVARSQMMPGHCTHLFFVVHLFFWSGGAGWGHAFQVNFCILEVDNYMYSDRFWDYFWNAVSLESGVVLTHDFSIRAHSTGLNQY